MNEEEPVIKRRRSVYGLDGMKLLSQRTIRRRRKALQRQFAEERRRLDAAFSAASTDEDRELKRLQEYVEADAQPLQSCSSGPNQRVPQYTDDVHSSDSDTPDTTAHASVLANEYQRLAMHQLYPHTENSATTGTSNSDEILDRSDATASAAESQHDDDIGSGVDDPTPSMHLQSSSPAPTDNDASSSIQADFDRTNYTADKVRAYLHTVTGETVMFPQSNMRCWQVVLVVLGLCIRFSLNKKARRGVIEAIKLFAGPQFSNWDITDYYLCKIFDPPDDVTLYHFYCEICCKELDKPVSKGEFRNHVATCNNCAKSYSLTMDAPNSFISTDLQYQLISLIHLKIVNDDLAKNLKNLKNNVRSGDEIRDVYDGSLYNKLLSETPRDSRLLTCSFNTDGAPLFNSSKRAFWPILVIINELSPRIRFRYPLLAGMCIVRKEPSPELMNTYMRPFVKDLQKLGTVGFDAQVGGEVVHFVLKPLFCGVDSVARPLLQNRLQFNGYFGCSWCYSKGQHINGCMRFLMEEPDPIERTHRDYLADVRAVNKKNRQTTGQAKKKCNTVRGVRGNSILTLLESWDMIWGFSRDYLHGDLFGCTLQLINMFNDPNCPIRLTKAEMDLVNERLMRMTPPHEVHRLVRPLKTERCKWKASEWRSWLIYYAIPCLTGILDSYALQHFALYVNGMYTLLQTTITATELKRAQYDLERFVIIFELLYGARYVTFNVHTIRHAVQSVRSCGPLWATSAFPFESTIHNLKQCVQGSRGVGEQMTRKTIQRNVYRSLLEEADASPAFLAFNQSLFERTEVTSYTRTDGSVVFLGNGVTYSGLAPEFRHEPRHEIRAFKRCISSGIVIHSAVYDKTTLKSDDTVFRTDSGKFVQVLYLLKYRETAIAEVACFNVEKVIVRCRPEQCERRPVIGNVTLHHLVRVVSDGGNKLIRVKNLIEKCVVIKVDEQTYISRMPNTVEIQ